MENNNNVVYIKLDRERELRYGHKALKTLTAITGKALTEMNMSSFDLEELEKIVYAGLLTDSRKNGEKLTLEMMEDLLDEAPSLQYVANKVGEALSKSLEDGEGKPKN